MASKTAHNQKCLHMDNETIKKNFAEARKQEGLSWADIAQKAGVKDYHTIANLFNSPGMTLATLRRLAELVNLQPWQLLKPSEDIGTQDDDQTAGTLPDEHDRPKMKPGQSAVLNCPLCGSRINVLLYKRDDSQTDGGKDDGTSAKTLPDGTTALENNRQK